MTEKVVFYSEKVFHHKVELEAPEVKLKYFVKGRILLFLSKWTCSFKRVVEKYNFHCHHLLVFRLLLVTPHDFFLNLNLGCGPLLLRRIQCSWIISVIHYLHGVHFDTDFVMIQMALLINLQVFHIKCEDRVAAELWVNAYNTQLFNIALDVH